MPLKKPALVLFGLLAALTGCESHGAVNALDGDPNAYWLEMDATRRSAFVVPGTDGGPPKILAEPAPDAMLSRSTEVVLKLAEQSGTASGDLTTRLAEVAAELSQQAETVKFVRDAMYRLSELYYNGAVDPEQVPELYRASLDAATAIARAKYAKATERAIEELGKVQEARRDALERVRLLSAEAPEVAAPLFEIERARLVELARQEAALREVLEALLPEVRGVSDRD